MLAIHVLHIRTLRGSHALVLHPCSRRRGPASILDYVALWIPFLAFGDRNRRSLVPLRDLLRTQVAGEMDGGPFNPLSSLYWCER